MFTLEPTSLALIGASGEKGKLGFEILQNLRSGFRGKVYPVNPKHTELLGLRCSKGIADIKASVDMAVVVTPASTVLKIAEECAKKKVKTLVVISAGFGELGTEAGKKAEVELTEIAERANMRLVGPNCLGLLRPGIGLNASFAVSPKHPGDIALVSQSGAMAVAILDAAEREKLGFSFVVSIGNKADLAEHDFLEILAHDSETKVIGLYLESVKDGPKFMEAAKRISNRKPIVLIKAGVSTRGAAAVSSHTGALAGSMSGLRAACEEAGVHLASSTEEFLRMLSVLRSSPPLPRPKIAIITNAGGPGVLATDAAEAAGLILSTFEKKTTEKLRSVLPPAASTRNPVDVLGDALEDRYRAALDACAKDGETEGIVALLTPQVMTPCEKIAKAVIATRKRSPLLPVVTAFMGGDHVESARALLRSEGIPSFRTPEEAVKAMAVLRTRKKETPYTEGDAEDDRVSAAAGLLKNRHGLLDESVTAELLSLYGLPLPSGTVARSASEAVEIARSIGYPVIAKVSSPDILHKTDVGGVRVHLQSDADVKRAYAEILKNAEKACPSAAVKGVLIQQFLPVGSEFIVGALRDPTYGPMVMAGLGGIYTELFKDTRFSIAPVSVERAYGMLSDLKSWKLLSGMRGKSSLDRDALAKIIHNVSRLIANQSRIREIDLNPVLVSEKEVVIADVKVILT